MDECRAPVRRMLLQAAQQSARAAKAPMPASTSSASPAALQDLSAAAPAVSPACPLGPQHRCFYDPISATANIHLALVVTWCTQDSKETA